MLSGPLREKSPARALDERTASYLVPRLVIPPLTVSWSKLEFLKPWWRCPHCPAPAALPCPHLLTPRQPQGGLLGSTSWPLHRLPELECSHPHVCLSHPSRLQIFAQMSSGEGAWLFLVFPYRAAAPRPPISQPHSSLTLTCLWSASQGRRNAPGEQGLLFLCDDGQRPVLRRAGAPCVLVGGLIATPLWPGTDLKRMEKLPLAGGDSPSPRASPVPPPPLSESASHTCRLAGCACSDLLQEGFEGLLLGISLTLRT